MKLIRYFAEKLCGRMMEKGIIKEEDADLYQYGIVNGIILSGNLLTAVVIGIMTGRLGMVLVFLSFYASLRTYSGGYHLESKIGCYFCSTIVLLLPICSYEWVRRSVPLTALVFIGIVAVATVVILSPVESIYKRLEMEERNFCCRASRCIVSIQMCIVVGLYYMDMYTFSYAGYLSILIVAILMIAGRMTTKRYT